jgi:replicative superfamily II helicase
MPEELLLKCGFSGTTVSVIKELLNSKELSLNKMQIDFLNSGFLQKDRVIISAPPASGKTLTACLKYFKNVENGKKRMIYIVPYIRMRRELLSKFAKLEKFGVTSTEDFEAYNDGKAQILVSTYSSIDSLLLHGKELASDFVVFDEFDMVTDDLQGTKTEGVIARILRESEIPSVYALSATIGSPELVEKWLKCETFSSDYRPGDFKKQVMEFPFIKDQYEIIEDIFNSEINEKRPMLVFYYDTNKCRKTAVKLAKDRAEKSVRSNKDIAEGIKDIIGNCDITNEINDQVECLNNGIAFYFSRIQPQCKEVIEGLLEKNVLDVVFTTPALARGINMPVRTVVIPFPYKFSTASGTVPLSRAEIEQILGRAARPPYHAKGSGIIVSTSPEKTKQFNLVINGKLEPMSSKFLQSAPKKGRILNRLMLAIEIVKEAKMKNRLEAELVKTFDGYLFMQEISNKDYTYGTVQLLVQVLLKAGLLEKNLDEEVITPDIVDIVIDSGIDNIHTMICLINSSKEIVNEKMEIHTGHVLSAILYQLCLNFTNFSMRTIKGKYDNEKVQRYIVERTQIEPKKIDNEHRLFMALDLYYNGTPLEKIENNYGIESDAIPYFSNIIAQDLVLLGKLITKQSMGNSDLQNFSDFLEISSSVIKKGLPYQVLPFGELIERLGRKTALNILEKYRSEQELLKVLSDESRTEKEFKEIEGIAKILGQRIIEKRKELIANLQRKITLWGTYNF